ncbi:lytic transglycosylase domain-containing protein [Neoaquamicrobium microcysteis]|uniref:lytic transglycosylase domain-containing protein n=1 Tax=Neoaquamicrobium microcysteis TaxID=2682781 RepID=UPI001F1A6024|nr:lytic transglycosylase domain-containing protein [Mesorhizobium microcysteis]
MPRLRSDIALCALLATSLLSACTTADLANDPQLRAQLEQSTVEADDPALPDEVAAVPETLQREVAEVAADASAVEVAAEAASFTPSAFAGPTPDNPATAAIQPRKIAARSPELDALIARYAAHHEIPVELLRRVVNRESTFNPAARNGPYWGLMQILPQTARTMGFKGSPEGLLDAETNLMYAGKYLRGAYLVAGGNHDLAVRFYSRGYYYDAKRKGLLEATGLRPARSRMPGSS